MSRRAHGPAAAAWLRVVEIGDLGHGLGASADVGVDIGCDMFIVGLFVTSYAAGVHKGSSSAERRKAGAEMRESVASNQVK